MKETLLPGYGVRLAQAREASGLSVADVAAKLKLTSRQVEALEAEDVSRLPGDLFLRGFVRNYARLVALEPDEILAPVDVETTVSATITARSEGLTMGSGGLRKWLLIPAGLFVVFLLAVALLYQWLRQGENVLLQETPTEIPAPGQEVAVSAPVAVTGTTDSPVPAPAPDVALPSAARAESMHPSDVPASAPVAAPPSGPDAPSLPAVPPASVRPGAPSGLAPTPSPAKAVLAPPAPSATTAPAGAPTTKSVIHVLRFSAAQDAWIQVVDGKGKRYSKLVRAGGSDAITGEAPFKLVVGEAAQVNLSYDGRVIDLVPFIGQKVARLTLE